MIDLIDVPQNTEEWFSMRRGLITASNFGAIMANDGKAFGEPAKKYAMRIIVEELTSNSIETFRSEAMIKGNELEPVARDLYQGKTGIEVFAGCFAKKERFGGSADGTICDKEGNLEGIIEIKSVQYNTHFERFLKGGFDTSYKWQIMGNMWLYEVKYCDYISYCQEFPEDKQLYIFRVDRDEEMINKLINRLTEFAVLVDSYKQKVKG